MNKRPAFQSNDDNSIQYYAEEWKNKHATYTVVYRLVISLVPASFHTPPDGSTLPPVLGPAGLSGT